MHERVRKEFWGYSSEEVLEAQDLHRIKYKVCSIQATQIFTVTMFIQNTLPLIYVSCLKSVSERERNVLFNDALNTFYLLLYGVRHMVKDQSDREKGNPPPHIGYSYRLTARFFLYAPSYRQDNTYHGLCYTSRGALVGTRNSSQKKA